jgi:cobalamin biosynthesis Mg chelatase CobN
VANNPNNERDAKVFALHEQLLEIEQRLIPTGLHVFGRASSAGEKTDLLKMIASFDRPEAGARALPEEFVDEAVRAFVEQGTDAAIALLQVKGIDAETTRPVFALLESQFPRNFKRTTRSIHSCAHCAASSSSLDQAPTSSRILTFSHRSKHARDQSLRRSVCSRFRARRSGRE